MAVIKPGGETSQRHEQQMQLDAQRAAQAAQSAQMAAPRAQRMATDNEGEVALGQQQPRVAARRQEPPRISRPLPVTPNTPIRPPANPPPPTTPDPPPETPDPETPDPETPDPDPPNTEIGGGAIPTTTDEWKSKQQWEIFNRRQETKKGLRDIAQMRTQAELDKHRAQVFRDRKTHALGMKASAIAESALEVRGAVHARLMGDEAVRTADVQAQLLLDSEALSAADQERLAQAAAINVESLEAEITSRKAERGHLSIITTAQVAQRQAQIDQIAIEAAFAIEDANLAAERADAEAVVMSAARGAGGQVIEAQRTEIEKDLERQVGRIGSKREQAHRRLRAAITEVRTKCDIAVDRAKLDVKKATGRAAQQRLARAGHLERQALVKAQAKTRAKEIREAGKNEESALDLSADEMVLASQRSALDATKLAADAAGFGIDAAAAAANEVYTKQIATEGLAALINRPPIPDWNAIGKKADRANRWSRASNIVGVVGTVLSWF